ncbi:glycoside hydrolase family 2 protein [Sedimentisphaera salicampi]|uniref:glycoside hydrolase family 2 protein n=1 Tax=Sedimentisphaera salicampi TaxID=1941349 RepID=UPI000B9C2BDC|nr:sugar-binding domain-containing protein [Sedimentisphaera salicampi]OXU15166.1 Beta-galactosidase [Sedimentisphaera salicampi]
MKINIIWLFAIAGLPGLLTAGQNGWEPVLDKIETPWASEVNPKNVLSEYPRPAMVREEWKNLNGLWNYSITSAGAENPGEYEGKILVPFPAESGLSGVCEHPGLDRCLWYERTFEVPKKWDVQNQRILLHFGAVDWHAQVWVNGRFAGEHKGGFDPFTFDITDFLSGGGSEKIVVKVWDPTDHGSQARGKQVTEPGGIYYTPVTGIWQTVWLESVPSSFIESLKLTPDIDTGQLAISVEASELNNNVIKADVYMDGQWLSSAAVAAQSGDMKTFSVSVPKMRLWRIDDPFLYDLKITLRKDGNIVDKVSSYFGMREVGMKRDEDGFMRLTLNKEPIFQYGVLDQGWWPDGLYTAPTDEALKYDIEVLQSMGFNMLRKHVKIEPARYYYHCDRMGMLVWQDMPNANPDGELRVGSGDSEDAVRDDASAAQFETELKAMVDNYYNYPSIAAWVLFNEGWGQYQTESMTEWLENYDPTRICNAVSGWADRGVGDVYDIHVYPGPGIESDPDRAAVLGEFGGLGWPVPGHLWRDKKNWGYRNFSSQQELWERYRSLMDDTWGLKGQGLAAAIYTQTTDVEGEVNGLLTYDRKVIKLDPEKMTKLHQRFYEPAGPSVTIMKDSEERRQLWKYSRSSEHEGWHKPDFDDRSWSSGEAPFIELENTYIPKGTTWEEGNLRLRRTFNLEEVPSDLRMKVFYNVGQADVFINGIKVKQLRGRCKRHYQHIAVPEAVGALREGENIVAVQCSAPDRRAAFDLGLYYVANEK